MRPCLLITEMDFHSRLTAHITPSHSFVLCASVRSNSSYVIWSTSGRGLHTSVGLINSSSPHRSDLDKSFTLSFLSTSIRSSKLYRVEYSSSTLILYGPVFMIGSFNGRLMVWCWLTEADTLTPRFTLADGFGRHFTLAYLTRVWAFHSWNGVISSLLLFLFSITFY